MRPAIVAAILAVASLPALSQAPAPAPEPDDPYLWLEDVAGERALDWVRARNAESQPALESKPGFKALQDRLTAIFASKDRIPAVEGRGGLLYNFWQDTPESRGVWRRTTMEEYRKPEPRWETVLDLDAIAAAEGQMWVWKGAQCLFPDYKRCLVQLSRAGADAVVVREYDIEARAFVKGGFELPEAKSDVAWRDADHLYVATDFGPGSMTTSGYPRIVKEWTRGTPLAKAKTVFEGAATDVGVQLAVRNELTIAKKTTTARYEAIRRLVDFWRSEWILRRGEAWVKLDLPDDAKVSIAQGKLWVNPRTAWKVGPSSFAAGSLAYIAVEDFMAGKREFVPAFEPKEGVSLHGFAVTQHYVLLDLLDKVKGRVMQGHRNYGRLAFKDVPLPAASSVDVQAVDYNASEDWWLTTTGFLQPTTLTLVRPRRFEFEKAKALPAFFDAKGLSVTQHEVASKDGTKVPYFVVSREGMKLDGSNPTILYGYGGFEIAMTPSYGAALGAAWLERGGTYVLANIRGGGEFGPEWHLTAMREGRQKAYDDFIAVAEDVIKRGIASPAKLGIYGGSQGGLLVGGTMAQRPELFGAVVATVPLFDMKRFHKLLAGASWMAEYGDPDKPADWAFMSKWSPYQLLAKEKKYPSMLVTTSTRDDRVHPGHARKLVARMKEQGHEVLYYERIEGGHSAGALPAQQAYSYALIYTFFADKLGLASAPQ